MKIPQKNPTLVVSDKNINFILNIQNYIQKNYIAI